MAKSATIQAENREIARRKLVSYRAQCDIYKQLLKIVESAESRLMSVTALYDEMRSGGVARDAMADQIITLESQIERLNKLIDEQAAALDEVLWLINSLLPEHPTMVSVLCKRYLEPTYEPTFQEIADDMGLSESRVKHVHLEGLDEISKIIKVSTF